jgi:hypothetical protein
MSTEPFSAREPQPVFREKTPSTTRTRGGVGIRVGQRSTFIECIVYAALEVLGQSGEGIGGHEGKERKENAIM